MRKGTYLQVHESITQKQQEITQTTNHQLRDIHEYRDYWLLCDRPQICTEALTMKMISSAILIKGLHAFNHMGVNRQHSTEITHKIP